MDAPAPHPVYVVGSGADAAALRAAFPAATPVASLEELGSLGERPAGLLVVERSSTPGDVLLELAEGAGPGWVVALGTVHDGDVRVRPLSLGWPTDAPEAARWAAEGGADGGLLELRSVLARVARARHDINNPLTSGLAETQLLLLDTAQEGEARDALETIQTQLRRIRDMVAALRTLRPPV